MQINLILQRFVIVIRSPANLGGLLLWLRVKPLPQIQALCRIVWARQGGKSLRSLKRTWAACGAGSRREVLGMSQGAWVSRRDGEEPLGEAHLENRCLGAAYLLCWQAKGKLEMYSEQLEGRSTSFLRPSWGRRKARGKLCNLLHLIWIRLAYSFSGHGAS